jgi:hypothetical protein
MTEIASSIKKGTIIKVARNPQKYDFNLLVWMATTTAPMPGAAAAPDQVDDRIGEKAQIIH